MQTEKENEEKTRCFKDLKNKNCNWMKSLERTLKTDKFLVKKEMTNLYK